MYIFQFHFHFALILIFVSKTFEKCVKEFKYPCEIGKKVHKMYLILLFSTVSKTTTNSATLLLPFLLGIKIKYMIMRI